MRTPPTVPNPRKVCTNHGVWTAYRPESRRLGLPADCSDYRRFPHDFSRVLSLLNDLQSTAHRKGEILMWIHASPAFIANGDYVLSPEESGYSPRWADAETVRRAEERGLYRRDHVCVIKSIGASFRDHIDQFSFVTEQSYIYEVLPIGPLEPDRDFPGHPSWWCCPRAQVLSCLRRPQSLLASPTQTNG
jgi:hypothetical protein